jgi:hypothetical protein
VTNAEIDRLVAEKVMGWTPDDAPPGHRPYWQHNGEGVQDEYDWQPTADIAQAFQVVERMAALEWHFSSDWYKGGWVAFSHEDDNWMAVGDSFPRVVCIAALKALGVEVEA